MNKKDPKLTVIQFNECINNQDAEGLASLMTEDFSLVMGGETTVKGKASAKNIWIQFFNMCPDYKNHFMKIEARGNSTIIVGFSTCSVKEGINEM